jgi:hypothetical protein
VRRPDPHALTDLQVAAVAELLVLVERFCDKGNIARSALEQECIEAFKRELPRYRERRCTMHGTTFAYAGVCPRCAEVAP